MRLLRKISRILKYFARHETFVIGSSYGPHNEVRITSLESGDRYSVRIRKYGSKGLSTTAWVIWRKPEVTAFRSRMALA